MPKRTDAKAKRRSSETVFICLEVPRPLKAEIKKRADELDLSVNQYLRRLANQDLQAAAA